MAQGKTILTGIKPTGKPHLGNLVGAINPVIELSAQSKESFVFIADLHALNALTDSKKIDQNTREIAAAFLAMGLDTEKTALFRQSDVHEVLALSNILNNVTPKGMMNRSHAYKAVTEQNVTRSRDADAGVNMGPYTYPILMAADILLYGVDIVPVGKDQKQHIEFTQDIARRFNNTFGGNTLAIPEAMIQETANAIPGLDGRKMSKSYNNTIPIFETPQNLKRLIGRIITDGKGANEAKNADESTIFQLYLSFANENEIKHMRAGLENGGMSYSEAKDLLFSAMNRALEEPRRKFQYYMNNPYVLDAILEQGAQRARVAARKKLKQITNKVLGRPMSMQNLDSAANDTDKKKFGQNRILREGFLARAGRSKVPNMKNRAISQDTARDFQFLARDLDRGNGGHKIVLTTGLGLADHGVPLRLPSLIVPGLNALRELCEVENADPHYVIYQARDFIVGMNRLDAKSAFNNAVICTEYLRKFVDEYFSDLKDRVTIVSGDDIILDKDHLNALAQRLKNVSDTPVAGDMDAIKGYASRRKTVDDSHLYYAAANVILNGGYEPHYPLKDYIPTGTSVVIPMGGKKEKPFFNLTRFIASESGVKQKVLPMLVPVGKIPAYYPNKQGDMLVGSGQETEGFVAPTEIKDDFTLLESLGITVDMLKDLTEKLQEQDDDEEEVTRNFGGDGPTSEL